MKHFAKMRRTTAVVVLSVLAVGLAVGIGHAVQGGPDYDGGLGYTHAVVRIDHRMKPDPSEISGF